MSKQKRNKKRIKPEEAPYLQGTEKPDRDKAKEELDEDLKAWKKRVADKKKRNLKITNGILHKIENALKEKRSGV